jgi:hypothetical protein
MSFFAKFGSHVPVPKQTAEDVADQAASAERPGPTLNETIGEHACFVCKTGSPEFKPSPCGCFECCKKCAMKMATGGKCRLCKQFFTNMTRNPTPNHAEETDTDGHEKEDGR